MNRQISLRNHYTLADYVVMAISPVLIMALVGSLIFFLLELAYKGQFETRIRWVFFWFVFGSVLVVRIAVERTPQYASFLGLLLTCACLMTLMRFITLPALMIVFFIIIWWCVSKLVYDCTVINDDEDASGQGLLQAVGWDGTPAKTAATRRPWSWNRVWQIAFGNPSKSYGRRHSPGLWVVWFSLAALPLFGLGQTFLSTEAPDSRQYAFRMLWVYLAAAVGLLLTTSFLGLRRYLRQRNVQMPSMMVGAWLGSGVAVALGALLFCLLIPRPDSTRDIEAIAGQFGSTLRSAAKAALLKDNAGSGNSMSQSETDSEEGEGTIEDGNQESDSNRPAGNDQSDESSRSSNEENQSGKASPPISFSFAWLKYLILAIALLWLLYIFRSEIASNLSRFFDWIRNLFRRPQSLITPFNSTRWQKRKPSPSFSNFMNPFTQDNLKSPDELVCYTFEALEAWAKDSEKPRSMDRTPVEFIEDLKDHLLVNPEDAEFLAQTYSQLIYARIPPNMDKLKPLKRIWQAMEDSTVAVS